MNSTRAGTVFDRPVRQRGTDIDPAVLAQAAGGERAALAQVFRAIHPTVLSYLRARLGPGRGILDSPEDIAQAVCLNLLRVLPRYQTTDRPFMAYVYTSAANAVTDARRRAARNRTDPIIEAFDMPDLAPGPEVHGLRFDAARRTRELLETLPVRQREVLVLRIALELSVRQTAELLELTQETVRVTQHRALNRLRTATTAWP